MKREKQQTEAPTSRRAARKRQKAQREKAPPAEAASEARRGRKGIRRMVPWGRHARRAEAEQEEPSVSERARAAAQEVGERSRETLSRARERAPSAADLRAQASDLREWAEKGVGAQPLALGLGALAIGFGVGALLPATRAERRALVYAMGAARQLDAALDTARQLTETTLDVEVPRLTKTRRG